MVSGYTRALSMNPEEMPCSKIDYHSTTNITDKIWTKRSGRQLPVLKALQTRINNRVRDSTSYQRNISYYFAAKSQSPASITIRTSTYARNLVLLEFLIIYKTYYDTFITHLLDTKNIYNIKIIAAHLHKSTNNPH